MPRPSQPSHNIEIRSGPLARSGGQRFRPPTLQRCDADVYLTRDNIHGGSLRQRQPRYHAVRRWLELRWQEGQRACNPRRIDSRPMMARLADPAWRVEITGIAGLPPVLPRAGRLNEGA